MLLSSILQEMGDIQFECINERAFDTLSIMIPGRDEKERLVFVENEDFAKQAIREKVNMVLTRKQLVGAFEGTGIGVCVVEQPCETFYRLHNYLSDIDSYKGVCFETTFGTNCDISDQAVISKKNVRIGNNVKIEPFVRIYENVIIDDNVEIRSGSMIGCCGFMIKDFDERMYEMKHVGWLHIFEGVTIFNNCCVDRGVFPYEKTTIGKNSKIGSLTHISHCDHIGERVIIPTSACINGFTDIGNGTWVGPASTVSNILRIGDNADLTIGSVVVSNIKKGGRVSGNFAIDHNKHLKNHMEILRK